MTWGDGGPGQWITVYSNPGHAYMVVAGLRFDTSGGAGPRWRAPGIRPDSWPRTRPAIRVGPYGSRNRPRRFGRRVRHGLRIPRGRGPRRLAAPQRRPARVADRLAPAHRAREVGGRRADDEPLVRRLRDAAPVRDRRRAGLLCEPVPGGQRLSRREADRADHALRVRDRPVQVALPAGRRDVLAQPVRQRERQPGRARGPVHRDDRDPDPGPIRCRDARDRRGRLRGARDADHRAPAPGPRERWPDQLLGEARAPQRIPVLPARCPRMRHPR